MPLKVNDENKFTLIKHSNCLKQVGKFGFGIMTQKKCLSSVMYTLNINSVGNWIKFNKSRGLQYLTQR